MVRKQANAAPQTGHTCPHNAAVGCSQCRLNNICLPLALEEDDIARLDQTIKRGRALPTGKHLYREGEDFNSLYAVRSGAIKTYQISAGGDQVITGFHLPGEVVGLEGLGPGQYAGSAIALELSSICEIPFDQIEQLGNQLPAFRHHLFSLLSREIVDDHQHINLLSNYSAEERLASLLLSLSARLARRGLSATDFSLPMSRTDIASYLGLTIETVSRVLKRFKESGYLTLNNRNIKALNLCALKGLLEISAPSPSATQNASH